MSILSDPLETSAVDQIAARVHDLLTPSLETTLHSLIQNVRETGTDSPLLTVTDVAKRLNVSKRTVETVIADGDLVPLRIRSARRFTRESVDAYLRGTAGR